MAIGFSQTFNLERDLLASLLELSRENPTFARGEVMSRLGVGDNKAEAMVTWLGKLGLRNNNERKITDLGSLILTHDPRLERITTMWLLHYQLASNTDAEVWYYLTNAFLPTHSSFTVEKAVDFLVSVGIGNNALRHVRADASIFLRSFLSDKGLSRTDFIKPSGNVHPNMARNTYQKNPPSNISPYIIAYVIYNQMASTMPNAVTVTIKELLTENGNVGKVFSIGRSRLESVLRDLSGIQFGRLVDLSTTAGLDQVGLRFSGDPIDILEMGYESKAP